MNETNKAWLAGFIDGEGYIGITYQLKKKTATSSATPRYFPFLIIAQSDKKVLDYVTSIIGAGKVYSVRASDGKWKEAFQYRLITKESLLTVLYVIFPYLQVKKTQCKILIEFLEYRKGIKPQTGRGRRGITSFTEKDQAFYQKLSLLNKRGPVR